MKESTRNQLVKMIERIDCALNPATGDDVRDLQVTLGQIACIHEDLPRLMAALRLEIDTQELMREANERTAKRLATP